MQLPLNTESDCGEFPDDQSCLICGMELTTEANSSISLDISTRGLRDFKALTAAKTGLSLQWTGKSTFSDQLEFIFLDLVKDLPRGQGRIHFCSTSCLRTFFSKVVDALDEEIEKVSSESASPLTAN